MRRNMDTVRSILLSLETKGQHEFDAQEDELSEHLRMMVDGGLLLTDNPQEDGSEAKFHDLLLDDGRFITAWHKLFVISWKGHEFIDSARNKGVWDKLKKSLVSVGGSASFEVTTQLLSQIILISSGLAK